MRAAWSIARADIARRWRALVALSILVGIAGAVILACVAGARRTETVYPRLLAGSRAYDAEVTIVGDTSATGMQPEQILDKIGDLPEVSEHGSVVIYPADEVGADKAFQWSFNVGGIVDPHLGRTFEKARVVAGRHPRVDAPFEAAASEALLQQRGLSIGDTVSFQPVTFEELFAFFGGRRLEEPSLEPVEVRIVGAWRLPHDVSFGDDARGLLYLTPAFTEGPGRALAALPLMYVRLARGTQDLASFAEAAREIVGDPEAIEVKSQADLLETVERAVDVQSTALLAFAALAGVASLLIIGQALARHVHLGAESDDALLAIGAAPRTIVAARALSVLPVVLAGGALSLAGAIAASAAFPFGFTRPLEIEPGVKIDMPVLAAGSVIIALVLFGRAAVAGRRAWKSGPSADPTRNARMAEVAARMALPASLVSGLRFAVMRGKGRAAVPLFTTLSGTMIGIVSMVATLVFAQSFQHLLDTPAEYGWTWDATIAGGEDDAIVERRGAALAGSRVTKDVTRARVIGTRLGEERLSVIALEPLKGNLALRLTEGRMPQARGQIALAAETLRDARTSIGGRFSLPAHPDTCRGRPSCRVDFEVVGTFVMPAVEDAPTDEGALMTIEDANQLAATDGFSDFYVNLTEGAVPADLDVVAADAIDREAGAGPPSVEIENLSRVRTLPLALAGALGVLAVATLSHLLITSVRRRGSDLAVLKTLGFVRGQIRSTVAWQATAVVAAALTLGIPIGIVAGRWSWQVVNQMLGLDAPSIVDAAGVGAGAVAAIIIANVVAALPARRAASASAATALRAL